jgi:hypothetical protein
MQQVWLFLHVLAAAVWFGANYAVIAMSRRYATIEGPSAADFQRTLADLGLKAQTPAAVLLLVSGVFLVLGNDAYGFGSGFVSLGFFTIIVGAVLGSRFFGPSARKAADQHEAGDTAGARNTERRVAQIGSADMALLAVTIAAMVWRWGA